MRNLNSFGEPKKQTWDIWILRISYKPVTVVMTHAGEPAEIGKFRGLRYLPTAMNSVPGTLERGVRPLSGFTAPCVRRGVNKQGFAYSGVAFLEATSALNLC